MSTQEGATYLTHSAEETRLLAEILGRLLRGGELICLFGDLGTGKTCMVQGIARGMGIQEDRVSSPTFTLHHEHQNGILLHHLDFYRVDRPDEIERLGLLELAGDPEAVTVVEWADRDGGLLPRERLEIRISWENQDTRRFHLTAVGIDYRNLLKRFEDRNVNQERST